MATIPDLSGHGRDATTQGETYVPGQTGPFTSGSLNFSVYHADSVSSSNVAYAAGPSNSAFRGTAVSADAWLWVSTTTSTITGLFSWRQPSSNNWLGVNVRGTSADPYDLRYDTAGSAFTNSISAVASRGAWHHVAVTWDGSNIRLYIDGTLTDTTAFSTTMPSSIIPYFAGNASFGILRGYCGPVAFYSAQLSGTQVGNHAAASGSWLAYKAAVLADSPEGFWHVGVPPGVPVTSGWMVDEIGMRA